MVSYNRSFRANPAIYCLEENTSVKFTDPFGLLLKILLIILLNFACFLCYCCGVVVADAILSVAHAVFEGCLSLWFLLC